MNGRNILLDFLKGFTIVLVVLGHAIQSSGPQNFEENIIFRIIYSFHMPLFMFISGFISFSTFNGTSEKLLKRFKSLVVPFIAWFFFAFAFYSLLFFLLRKGEDPDFIQSLKSLIKFPDTGLWFLWVLFLIYLILFISLKINKKKAEIILLFFFIIFNIVFFFTKLTYFGFDLLSWHILFFLIGYVLAKHEKRFEKIIYISGLMSFFIFPILVSFWSKGSYHPLFSYFDFNHGLKLMITFLYRISVPISAILAIYVCFKRMIAYDFFLKTPLTKLGNISLEIYCTQFYFFYFIYTIEFLPFYLRVIIAFVVALLGSIIIQFLIKKNAFLSIILFGKKQSGSISDNSINKEV